MTARADSHPGRTLPLQGLRVVEVCQNLAGPLVGRILGDMGAEVIKVEPPPGDAAREWGPPFHEGVGTIFAWANTGKRGIRLDLATDEGLEVLGQLVGRADVLVESLRPGALEKMGMGWDAARSLNQRLIYASVLAYGEEGPLRDLPGYEPLMQAHGGLLSCTGEKGGQPVRVGTSVVDMGTGMWLVVGILGALRERDRTGQGGRVTGALFDTALTWSGYHLLGARSAGVVPSRMGTELPMIAPYGTFPAKDAPLMISAGTDALFRRLCEVLGIPELGSDPRFERNRDRVAHREALNTRIRQSTVAFTVDALLERLRSAGVPAAPVKDVGQLLEDPQLRASGMMGEDSRGRPYGALPLRWDGARPASSGRLPDPERDAPDLLAELDVSDSLRAAVLSRQAGRT